jgi:hypothetical protein
VAKSVVSRSWPARNSAAAITHFPIKGRDIAVFRWLPLMNGFGDGKDFGGGSNLVLM